MAQPNPNPADATLTDPTATLVNLSSLDFLLIELVPMAYRVSADLAAREEDWLNADTSSASKSAAGGAGSQAENDAGSTVGVSVTGDGAGTAGAGTAPVDEEEAREAVFHRLESLGYRVGLGIVERYDADSLWHGNLC